jgi:voltage-gated potassium channel
MANALRQRIADLLQAHREHDRLGRSVDIFLIALIVLNIIAIVLESVPRYGIYYSHEFFWFEVFSVAIFTLEYLLRLWSAPDTRADDGQPTGQTRLQYMLSPMALIDLLAILPFYLSFFVDIDLRFLRVVRLLRIFKLTRYSSAMNILLSVLREESNSLFAALFVLLVMLMLASSGIYLIEHEIQPDAFGSIPDSMWWAMATLTTVGYGDVTPITPMGKFFGGCITVIGMGMVALPAGILASAFSDYVHRSRREYQSKLSQYLRDGDVSDSERKELEQLRLDLGLSPEDAVLIFNTATRHVKRRIICPHCEQPFHDNAHKDKAGDKPGITLDKKL